VIDAPARAVAVALVVGEEGPSGPMALFPYPVHRSGGRLCHRVMGVAPMWYVQSLDRTNLCHDGWDARTAARRAAEIATMTLPYDVVVLLGSRVCRAFGVSYRPFRVTRRGGRRYVVLPHPSARCRTWNDPESIGRARSVLSRVGILP
jgi:hypothetical protein